MNVCLLALSTIPGKGDKRTYYSNSFRYKDHPPFNTYYQLEPILKVLNEEFSQKNEKLDAIIAFSTESTREEKIKQLTFGGNDTEYENISAEEYFKISLTTGEKPFSILPEITFIPIDENNILPGIAHAINVIREKKENNDNFHLYVDIHGGLRNTQMATQTILSLLKHEDIEPEGLYAVTIGKNPNAIQNVTSSFEYMDFVSGMNEFLNFGRPISIQRMSSDPILEEFAETANKLSESLTLCNVDDFQIGIEQMRIWYQKYKNNDTSIINMFINMIENDYGKLLNEEHTTIDEIEWCLKKDYLQQALTIIESKMPIAFITSKVLAYRKNDSCYNPRIKIIEAINNCRKGWENPLNYLFNQWMYSHTSNEEDSITTTNETRTLRNIEYTIEKFNLKNNRDYYCISVYVNSKIVNSSLLNDILVLHKNLKNERNKINHARKDNRLTAEDIRDLIKKYIDKMNEIYEEIKN